MITDLEATPGQLAELKLLVPKVATLINEFQMTSIASSLDFQLAKGVSVREALQIMVSAGAVTEDALVDIVRTIRIALLRPSWNAATDRRIAEVGYSIKPVFASEESPAFAYTIGLNGTAGFELIAVAGGNHELLYAVVEHYAELAKSGENLELERTDVIELNNGKGCRTKCIPVEAVVVTRDFITERRGEVKRVYQVLIADKNNRFPLEDGYDQSFLQIKLPRPLL